MAENKKIKMRYKNFEFPSNPQNINASSSSKIDSEAIFGSDSFVAKIADNPCIISGSGTFFGDDAEMNCQLLARLMKDKNSGLLFCPGMYPIKAFLSEFKYQLDSKKQGASYSFSFIEDCTHTETKRKFIFTYASDGENAFDIAARCFVQVDDIMRLNDIKTPFDISEGERIRIYENCNDRY